jgi:hypothetical protein
MLLATAKWPRHFDVYLLRFFEGHEVPPHTDRVKDGEHHRINVVLKNAVEGGQFICKDSIYESKYIKYFRPDTSEHKVTKIIKGSRYVFSFGWIKNS